MFVTEVPEPFVSYIGLIVVKEDIRLLVIINPIYVIKKVTISLQRDIGEIESKCISYTAPTKEGWRVWLKGILTKRPKVKQDLAAKMLGRDTSVNLNVCIFKEDLCDSELIMRNYVWRQSKENAIII